MRTSLVAHPTRRSAMAIVFTAVLVTAFFALAPAVEACQSQIAITKIETGSAAPGATYTITITGADFHREVDVAAGGTVEVGQVPPGTYLLAEANAPDGATIVPNPVIVTDRDDGRTIEVVVTNHYPAGRLAIEKVQTGLIEGGTYTFDITGPDGAAFDVDVAAGATWTSDWLPLGSYAVAERNAPVGHTITPNPAIIDTDGETVTVTAVNPGPEPLGTLAIHKVETGDTAPGGTYTFDITGPDDVVTQIEIAAGDTWSAELPLGEYVIAERGAPTGHTIEPNPAVLDADGASVTVTATNPYRDFHGKLTITKTVTGDAGGAVDFTFDVTGPDGVTFGTEPIANGETWTSGWLPLGTYTIAERERAGRPLDHPQPGHPRRRRRDRGRDRHEHVPRRSRQAHDHQGRHRTRHVGPLVRDRRHRT